MEKSDTVMPPADAMRKAVVNIEREAAKNGWDQPPSLIALMGSKASNGYLVIGEELPFGEHIEGSPVMWLGVLVRDMRPGQKLERMARMTAELPFVGIALCFETWHNSHLTEEEANAPDRPPLADIVGSEEARCVSLVDTAGRHVMVSRIRGGEPEIIDDPGADGRLVRTLARFALAVAEFMPPDAADPDALKELAHGRR